MRKVSPTHSQWKRWFAIFPKKIGEENGKDVIVGPFEFYEYRMIQRATEWNPYAMVWEYRPLGGAGNIAFKSVEGIVHSD